MPPDIAESRETIDEAIDRAKAAAADLEVNVQKLAVNAIDHMGQMIRGIVADLLTDENHIIAALDGWKVEIAPITITLRRPK